MLVDLGLRARPPVSGAGKDEVGDLFAVGAAVFRARRDPERFRERDRAFAELSRRAAVSVDRERDLAVGAIADDGEVTESNATSIADEPGQDDVRDRARIDVPPRIRDGPSRIL